MFKLIIPPFNLRRPSINNSSGHAIFILRKLSPHSPKSIPADKKSPWLDLKNSDNIFDLKHKKASLSDQHKEIEENNKMGKTWDLLKKLKDNKGIFHAKMGTIKNRKGMEITDAEDLRRSHMLVK